MITRGPKDAPIPAGASMAPAAVASALTTAGGVRVFAVVDPGDVGRRGSTLMLWVVRGRFVLVQELAGQSGVDVYYPSPALQLNHLMAELRGYIDQGWDALRAGGSFR